MHLSLNDRSAAHHEIAFDMRELRDCFGAFYTGVTVVTTTDPQGGFHGTTVNSFSSLSLDPPLALWSQRRASSTFPVFSVAKHFIVNILADDQLDMSSRFASGRPDKFSDLEVSAGLGGVPILPNCSAYLQCSAETNYPGGDHVIFIGRVERIETTGRPPLLFGGGRYQVARPLSASAPN
ncbi:flavin reductase family protein [Bosea sp. (in: a-proteobacteria)]|uniref:flavin reductase family protein n=1 Tax=Bosea sp. (in: a-proteobacteria) TaxID=1871050 RepID=UPI003B3B823A